MINESMLWGSGSNRFNKFKKFNTVCIVVESRNQVTCIDIQVFSEFLANIKSIDKKIRNSNNEGECLLAIINLPTVIGIGDE